MRTAARRPGASGTPQGRATSPGPRAPEILRPGEWRPPQPVPEAAAGPRPDVPSESEPVRRIAPSALAPKALLAEAGAVWGSAGRRAAQVNGIWASARYGPPPVESRAENTVTRSAVKVRGVKTGP